MTLEQIANFEKRIEEFIQGDCNGIVSLQSEFSDWIEVKLNKETAEITKNSLKIDGYIPSLDFWYDKKEKLYKTEWGSSFCEKELKKYNHEYDCELKKGKLFVVKATWWFSIRYDDKTDLVEIEEEASWEDFPS